MKIAKDFFLGPDGARPKKIVKILNLIIESGHSQNEREWASPGNKKRKVTPHQSFCLAKISF